jgi:hypothetical protein
VFAPLTWFERSLQEKTATTEEGEGAAGTAAKETGKAAESAAPAASWGGKASFANVGLMHVNHLRMHEPYSYLCCTV